MYLQGRWDVWHPKITTPPGLCVALKTLVRLRGELIGDEDIWSPMF